MDLLEALERSEIVEERIALFKLLETSGISSDYARSVAIALFKSWKMSQSQELEYRLEILAAASSQISANENNGALLVKYGEIASEACAWFADDSCAKTAQLPLLRLISALFSQSDLLLCEPDITFKALLENYLRFVKTASLSETFRDASKEIQLAHSTSLKLMTDTVLKKLTTTRLSSGMHEIYACVLQALVEIGAKAAAPGLVSVSWRVAARLLEMEAFHNVAAGSISISNIISTLLSLASEWLTLALRPTQSLLDDTSGNLKSQHLVMVKFYVVHALRISRAYLSEAVLVQKAIAGFSINISALLLVLENGQPFLETISNDLSVQVAPPSLAFLHTLLSSEKIQVHSKRELIEYITNGDVQLEDMVVNVLGEAASCQRYSSAAEVVVFIQLLQLSREFQADVLFQLSRKLDWLLERLSEMPLHAMLLQQRALVSIDAKPGMQLLYLSVLQALEAFVLAAASKVEVWEEVERFIFRNAIHRFSICRELLLDLWSFIFKVGNEKLCQAHLEALLSLYRYLSSSSYGDMHSEILEDFARLICRLAKFAPGSVRARLTSSVFKRDVFTAKSSAVIASLLLRRGFAIPKNIALEQVRAALDVISSNSFPTKEEALSILLDLSSESHTFQRDVSNKISKLLLSIIDKAAVGSPLLSKAVLGLARLKAVFSDSDIENAVITLKDKLSSHHEQLEDRPELKIHLPELLTSLADITFQEEEPDSQIQAIWKLYHLALAEKHWALVHAGLTSFSEFAATTSCNDLWRFLPADAALSFDSSGDTVMEDGFMAAVRLFLEKATDRTALSMSDGDLELLREECESQRASQDKLLRQTGTAKQEQGNEATAAVTKIREGIALLQESPRQKEILHKLIAELQSLQNVPGTL
ncbi:uncharacterized protein LOC9659504 isoform X1 [Selaginella moellendorffii]|uniref:uncharacterized protein LOC9659504 isoform X1 n=1 Tax=Selaginella moellendorffii TaxID=88036 RepID=UPI000D1C7CFE|nr:uncharacterized protein LOC9659504 isoform X1 [Selaginella moellendorffii]|eukprot:XP_024530174.1 uncharacterized protein LOC9659504 isoform X1 [Selaginella moellendorffii]